MSHWYGIRYSKFHFDSAGRFWVISENKLERVISTPQRRGTGRHIRFVSGSTCWDWWSRFVSPGFNVRGRMRISRDAGFFTSDISQLSDQWQTVDAQSNAECPKKCLDAGFFYAAMQTRTNRWSEEEWANISVFDSPWSSVSAGNSLHLPGWYASGSQRVES